MLENLSGVLEPLLVNYGIWVALFFAFMVAVPVGLIVWLQKKQNRNAQAHLSVHYDTLAEQQQQVKSWLVLLNHYQQQTSLYSGETQAQSLTKLHQQESLIRSLNEVQAELQEIEAVLAEEPEQFQLRLNDVQASLQPLKIALHQIETWHQQLQQVLLENDSTLQELQSRISSQTELHLFQTRWEALQQQAAHDPLGVQQACEQLNTELSQKLSASQVLATARPEQTLPDKPSPEEKTTELPSETEALTAPERKKHILQSPQETPLPASEKLQATLNSQALACQQAPVSEALPGLNQALDDTVPEAEHPGSEEAEQAEKAANPLISESEAQRVPFAEAEADLVSIHEMLQEIDTLHDQLSADFEAATWVKAWPLKDKARYQAEEAQELLKLARYLYTLPQAPAHRARLNRERVQAKQQALQESYHTLKNTLETLKHTQSELRQQVLELAKHLQQSRDTGTADLNTLQNHVENLKTIQKGLGHAPVALHKYQQMLQSLETTLKA